MFRKFEFYISESMGPTYSLRLKDGKWLYETENDWEPLDLLVDRRMTMDEHRHNEVISHIDSIPAEIFPTEQRIKRFHQYLKRYCKHWKEEYAWMQYCDGTLWECEIEGDGFELKSKGHVESPGNFETFLNKLTKFTEGKYFGGL